MVDMILILLVASLISVGLAQRLGFSPIIGFLLAGILFGPYNLGLFPDTKIIHQVAEFGIVFLMFTIGLEFSLSRLLTDRFMVLILGSLQVLLTTLAVVFLAILIEFPIIAAVTIGGALAMSSTAIVSRMLIEEGSVSTLYGRTAICILLFQDLATILFLMVMPILLSGSLSAQALQITLALAKGAAVFIFLLFVGRRFARPLFRYIALLHSPELFMLTILVVGLGAAKFAHAMGLSLALGGFMAGLVLGETEFRHQVEADIRPFQDVLLGLFFISVGMLIDLESFFHIWPTVLITTSALILIKALLVFGLLKITGTAAVSATRTALSLAHTGEFGLVILFLAFEKHMLPGEAGQIILSAVLLSMVVAPFLIRYSRTLSEGIAGISKPQTQQDVEQNIEEASSDLNDHLILCGYGRVGENLARYLAEERVEYIALDFDLKRLRQPAEAGEWVRYGDATRRHILVAAGLERAQIVVITFNDIRATLKTLSQIHELRPDITTIVRATDELHLDELLDAGATEVIPDTLETSLTMASHILTMLGVPLPIVAERSARIRADRYRLLRSVFHGHARRSDQLRIISIPPGAYAIGRTLDELRLDDYGVNVTGIRRRGIHGPEPRAHTQIQANDALIMHGDPEALAKVDDYLTHGVSGE